MFGVTKRWQGPKIWLNLTPYYQQWVRFLSDEAKRAWLFTPQTNAVLGDFSTYESFLAQTQGLQGQSPLDWALQFDAQTFLQGLLVVGDKLGMSASLEERVPLLDHDLVDFSLGLPAHPNIGMAKANTCSAM